MSDRKLTDQDVRKMMEATTLEVTKMGKKTTVVCATLPNGFEIVASSSCVDPENYDHEMGKSICLERIEDKIWELEGYLLQNR